MRYAYYPGCSLTASAVEYDTSTRRVLQMLGLEITEIEDWTCCGASAAEPVSRLLSYALPARNLALAERDIPGADVLVPCSACYLNLLRVQRECQLLDGGLNYSRLLLRGLCASYLRRTAQERHEQQCNDYETGAADLFQGSSLL